MVKSAKDVLITFFIISIPLFIWRLFDGTVRQIDLPNITYYSGAWDSGIREFYLKTDCPYPAIGALVTGGLMNAIEMVFGTSERARYYNLSLALGEMVRLLLCLYLLQYLRIRRPLKWLLVLAILPASWAGSYVWGMPDGLVQICILISIAGFASSMKVLLKERTGSRSVLWFSYTAGILGLVALFLIKQWAAIVTGPGLLLLWLAVTYLIFLRAGIGGKVCAVAVLCGSASAVLIPEFIFAHPPEYSSHLSHTWIGPLTSWERVISRNGFNIWIFGFDLNSSADTPLIGSLTPHLAGRGLLLAYVMILSLSMLRFVFRWLKWPAKNERFLVAQVLLFISCCNLAANVLATSTHERHLYNFYPFLLVSAVFFYKSGKSSLLLICISVLGGVAYGSFVFSVIAQLPELLRPLGQHRYQAIFHLALLGYLAVFWRSSVRAVPALRPQSRVLAA